MRRKALFLAILALLLTALAGTASAAVRPDTGVPVYNADLCGPNQWVRVKLPASEFTVHDSGGVCITSERHHLDFRITANAQTTAWSYPNINSGYEQGDSSCASARDTCYAYPVRERDDGDPTASLRAWLAPGRYNLAFDVWFSPSSSALSYQDRADDTEIMIWLAQPGIVQACTYTTRIEGTDWCVRAGWTGEGGDSPWERVTFEARRTALGALSVSGLRLNPFFENAIRAGMLTPGKWLYAIDLGNELYTGGVGSDISYYDLEDVN
jgi:hypothetical protein